MNSIIYLALGSNLGDREANLASAVESISLMKDTLLIGVSNIYETEPVGYTDQDSFLNMAVSIKTGFAPLELLYELQKIEADLKRTREIRWGPRTIDIDILLFEDVKLDLPQLTIPHPRMLSRAFVLIPLKDIYTGEEINGISFKDVLDECEDKNGVRLFKGFDFTS